MVIITLRKTAGGKVPRLRQPWPAPNPTETEPAARKGAWERDGPFRFLDLPPELRNRVYRYVFTAEDVYGETDTWTLLPPLPSNIESYYENSFEEDESMLAILQTCKQINGEARTIPFNGNIIRFTDVQIMAEAAGYMDFERISAINCIELDLSFDYEKIWCWGMLKLFPNLTHLRLVDTMFESDLYLTGPNNLIGTKIMELRGLTDLEVVLERDFCDRPEKYAPEIAKANQLAALWKPSATRPKA